MYPTVTVIIIEPLLEPDIKAGDVALRLSLTQKYRDHEPQSLEKNPIPRKKQLMT